MLPQISADGNGGAFVCWRDARNGDDDIYMQHIFSDGTTGFPHNGVPLCDAPNTQQYPRMVSDGRGGAYAAWEDGRSGIDLFVYAQRIGTMGQSLWQTGGIQASETPGIFISISLEPITGGILLGWSTVADAYVQCLDSLGNRVWGVRGVQVTNRAGSVYPGDVSIIDDGRKGAIVAWNEGSFANGVIYVQRVDSSGVMRWGLNGMALTDSSSSLSSLSSGSDGRGGAIISWGSSNPVTIHVQRVDSSGTIQWPSEGIVLMNSAGGGDKRNTPDGFGGAFVGHGRWIQWIDSLGNQRWPGDGIAYTNKSIGITYSSQVRDGSEGIWNFWNQSEDIFGQYISTDGTQRWDSTGALISGGGQYQDSPRAASSGKGTAIVVWDDFRNAHSNVYAAGVDRSGVITGVLEHDALSPSLPGLEQNYPNPFNPRTTIKYRIEKTSNVSLKIYDVLGNEVATLVEGQQHPGYYQASFETAHLSSGVYFGVLRTEQKMLMIKMMVIR